MLLFFVFVLLFPKGEMNPPMLSLGDFFPSLKSLSKTSREHKRKEEETKKKERKHKFCEDKGKNVERKQNNREI